MTQLNSSIDRPTAKTLSLHTHSIIEHKSLHSNSYHCATEIIRRKSVTYIELGLTELTSASPDDDYFLPHQSLWMFWSFDAPQCPPWATERLLLQPLICGTVF